MNTFEPTSTKFKLLLQAVQDNKITHKELVIILYHLMRQEGIPVCDLINVFRRRNPEYSNNEDDEPEGE